MDTSTKRKVGAVALVAAGIVAFLVPFLLHGPSLQAANNGGGTDKSGCTTNCGSGSNPPPTKCVSDDTTNWGHDHSNNGQHVAAGHDNQNNWQNGVNHFMDAMAKHNADQDVTHSTKTDNHTVNEHSAQSNGMGHLDPDECSTETDENK